jgi:hypothetical protein
MISEIDRGNHSFFRDYVIFSNFSFCGEGERKKCTKESVIEIERE